MSDGTPPANTPPAQTSASQALTPQALTAQKLTTQVLENMDAGPALRTIAMPADTNPNGDIFGGWLLSQMDLAGGVAALRRAGGRVATVGVEAMTFHKPVYVGDEVSCFAHVEKVGRTSIRVRVETWVRRQRSASEGIKVTEGVFTYVAIGEDRMPREVPPE